MQIEQTAKRDRDFQYCCTASLERTQPFHIGENFNNHAAHVISLLICSDRSMAL